MPSNGRWRRIEIVVPSRASEIAGGIKNALDRGEPLAKAKQSFINGGYTQQEVQEASQMVRSSQQSSAAQQSLAEQKPAASKKMSEKKIYIIAGVAGAVVVIIALTLGLFWDKIFG